MRTAQSVIRRLTSLSRDLPAYLLGVTIPATLFVEFQLPHSLERFRLQ
jgi:hypothetical protein